MRSENSPGPGESPKTPAPVDASTQWRLSGLGLEFVGIVAGFGALGWLADLWLKTSPWFTLGGVVLGVVGGGVKFIRQIVAASRRAQEEYKRAHPDGSYRTIPDDDDDEQRHTAN